MDIPSHPRGSRSLYLFALLGAFALLSGPAFASTLEPFTATYSVSRAGIPLGKVVTTLRQLEEGVYVYESQTKPTGLVALVANGQVTERSTFQMSDGTLEVLKYDRIQEDSKKNRDIHLEFDWDNNQAMGTHKGTPKRFEIPVGAMDPFVTQLAVMLNLRKDIDDMTYPVVDGKRVKEYHIRGVGHEQVETKLGRFDTVIMRRGNPADEYMTTLWCAPELDYLPVRIEHKEEDSVYRSEIEKLKKPSNK